MKSARQYLFIVFIFLTSCSSDDSNTGATIGEKTALAAPTELALEIPSTSPHTHPTPTIRVSGVEEGAIVTLYSDSSCETQASDGVKVEGGEEEVSITSHSLGDGSQDVEASFYALQRDRAGNESPCSSVSVSYIADLAGPSKPTVLSLSEPSTSPGNNPAPVILVEGVEEGAEVTLYSDSSCHNSISSTQRVAAGQTSILVTSHHLGSSDRSVDYYSAQVDIFERSSGCSTTSVSYILDFLPTLSALSLERGSYFYDDPSSDTLELSVRFSENVSVTGNPHIQLTIGATTRYATYASGTGTSTLIFSYDVSSDDYDSNGIQMATAIDLNNGTIQDSGHNNVPLSFTVPNNLGRVWINFEEKIFSTSSAFAFLKKGGSVLTWGDSSYGGDSASVSSDLERGVMDIASTLDSFAVLKEGGSVIAWGDSDNGGDSSNVSSDLERGVVKVFSNSFAFVALKNNGSVITWGDSSYGGDSASLSSDLQGGVVEIFSNSSAFAALKNNGSVVTWGKSDRGGDSQSVSSDLESDVEKIFSTNVAFAALKNDGSVVTWGSSRYGGNSEGVSPDLERGVEEIFSTPGAFAALKDGGSLITWGDSGRGGNSHSVSSDLESGVGGVFSNNHAFAALKDDGSVITWGDSDYGGDSSNVSSDLTEGVVEIFSNPVAFVALKDDGSVITWGDSDSGGGSSNVSSDLSEGVVEIFSTDNAFAALKDDGSVITWGESDYGGDSSNVSSDLTEGAVEIFSTDDAFAALKDDGSVITWGDNDFGGDSSGVDLSPRW